MKKMNDSFSLNKKGSPMMTNKASIKILYTSDVHGQAMPIIYGTNEEADTGLAKYATVVHRKRQENDHLVVIDNGDLIQGTPFMTHYVKDHSDKENPMVTAMNEIGLDASIIGNHEFNFGLDMLCSAVKASRYPWLSANILDERTGEPYFGKPYILKTFSNGIKVAIIGVTTHFIPHWESPEHIKGLQFADAYQTLKQWVQDIHEKEQPHLLIASYHGGIERDLETGEPLDKLTGENQAYKMAREIEGIDILLTGHQHRVLTGTLRDCLVIQPGSHGNMYGEIDVEFIQKDNHWLILDKQADVKTLEGIEADPVIINKLQSIETSTQSWLNQPIGQIEGDMTIEDPFLLKIKKHPFIELIQKIQMEATGADISVTSLLNQDSQGFPEIVTMRDVVSNYIYPNTLVVLSLTGRDIKEAIEQSATYFILDDDGNITVNPSFLSPKPQHYNYDMWEGIDYTIDVSKPFGSRVETIYYQGKPLHMESHYDVVLNNYRASGGGDFDMYKNKPVVKDIHEDMVTLISKYFNKHQTVQATVTENFVIKA